MLKIVIHIFQLLVDLVRIRRFLFFWKIFILFEIGEAIQDSETLVEFVKKSFSIVINTCNV
jgi:hypothetical protein